MWKGIKFSFTWMTLILFVAIPSESLSSASEAAAEEDLRIAIQVFREGKMVQGLENLPFRVTINGEEQYVTGINAFSTRLNGDSSVEPRLMRTVVLILNVAPSQEPLISTLESFFKKCLYESDSILVFTNHFALPLRYIGDKEEVLKRIGQLVSIELDWQSRKLNSMKMEMNRFLQRFRRALGQLDSGESGAGGQVGETSSFFEMELPRFKEIYNSFINDYREHFMQIPSNSLKRLEWFIENYRGDCKVVAFFQKGGLPRIKSSAHFMKAFENTMRLYRSNDSEMQGMSMWDRMMEVQEKTSQMQAQLNDSGDFRLNPGKAIFHSLFYPPTYHESFLKDEFEWKAVKLQAEIALTDASRKSGGVLLDNGDSGSFIEQISTLDEPYYELSLEPGGKEINRNSSIQIVIDDGNPAPCKIVWLNGVVGAAAYDPTLEIRIKNPAYEKKVFSFSVKNFMPDPVNGGTKGRIEVRIQIVNENLESVLNNKNEFTVDKKDEPIQIHFPKMKKGNYDVILTVTDLVGQTSDMILYSVKI